MENEAMFVGYVYAIKNDVNNKIYVGQTVKSLKWRLVRHLDIAREKKETHQYELTRAINTIGEKHFFIQELATIYAKDLKQLRSLLHTLECKYIEMLDSYNNGYNCTTGGGGTSNVRYSEKAMENYRKYNAKRVLPKATLAKAIEKNSKKTLQYTLDGKFIKEYESAAQAARANGLRRNQVTSVCRGVQKKSGSYVFKYANENM